LPGLVATAQRNLARGFVDLALFEVGTVFLPHEEPRVATAPIPSGVARPTDATLASLEAMIPDQPRYVGALFLGDAVRKQPGVDAVGRGLGDALDVVAQVGAALGVVFDVAAGERRGMHPGRTATVRLDGEPVGFAAELLPSLAAELDLPRRA